MSKFENPSEFTTYIESGDIKIQYSNLMEIAMGGPEVGNILINNILIKNHRFGGPLLIKKQFVYAPVFIRRFFFSGFRLARINLTTLKVDLIGKKRDLIFLERIENNKVYFYEDYSKSNLTSCSVE